jgi:chitin synthase
MPCFTAAATINIFESDQQVQMAVQPNNNYISFLASQLLVAQILSTSYALIMMAVIVGTALQLGEDGIGSPSAIFLIALSGSFFIAACLHPQEFFCIVPGLIYLLSIPSMYLLLILYSLINLNVVSWGTREVAVKKTKKVRTQPNQSVKF